MFLQLSVILFGGVSVEWGLCLGDTPAPYGNARAVRILVEYILV